MNIKTNININNFYLSPSPGMDIPIRRKRSHLPINSLGWENNSEDIKIITSKDLPRSYPSVKGRSINSQSPYQTELLRESTQHKSQKNFYGETINEGRKVNSTNKDMTLTIGCWNTRSLNKIDKVKTALKINYDVTLLQEIWSPSQST